jgi:drug/metabolite transporter (DMT)-like permease
MPAMSAITARRRALGLVLLVVLIGSFSFTFIELVLRRLSPNAMAAGRVVISAIAFMAVVGLQPRRRTPIAREHRVRLILTGLGASAGFHLLFSAGQDRVTVATSAVVQGTFPAVVAAGEWLFLRHRLDRAGAAGLVLSVVGLVVISSGAESEGSSSLLGIALVLGSVVVWAGTSIATRSLADHYDPWWLNTPGTIAGAMVMLAVAAPSAGEFADLTVGTWLLLIWLGAGGSALVYAALAGAMRVLPATTTASVATLVVPVSILIAWAVLGEAPTIEAVAGSVAVVSGVVLVSRERDAPNLEPANLEPAITRSRDETTVATREAGGSAEHS